MERTILGKILQKKKVVENSSDKMYNVSDERRLYERKISK